MRVFVIWDLATPTLRTFLEALPELLTETAGEPLTWQIPGISAGGGEVARDIISAGIRQSDQCIALLDRPSSSVGWQLGLALGWRKSLQLASLESTAPAWTHSGALKGLAVHHLADVASMRQLLTPLPWELPAPAGGAEPGGERLILCPDGPLGSSLRAVALQDPGSRALPADGWGLYELPQLLARCTEVVWILAPDGRQGADNAAAGVVAGLAEARGLRVAVLRAAELPPVADVQPRELRFANLAEFKQKLEPLTAASRSPQAPASTAARAVLPKERSGAGTSILAAAVASALLTGGLLSAWLKHEPKAPPPVPSLATPAPTSKAPQPDPGSEPPKATSALPPSAPPVAVAANVEQHPVRRRPRAAGAPSCSLSEPQFRELLMRIKDGLMPERMWRAYEQGTYDRCLTIDQLIQILDRFILSSDKLRVMKLAEPRIRDRQNAERLKHIDIDWQPKPKEIDAIFFPERTAQH